jgi:phosphate transport system substrate-binding protein
VRTPAALALTLATMAVLGPACTRTTAAPTDSSPRMLVGAGATLPFPLYSKWATEYAKVEPTVRVNYQSIGSGAGVRQVSDGVVDFGATDEPMTDDQLKRTSTKLVHVPTIVGAVVFAFNLPGERELALTGVLAADIFLGNVKRWDDDRIRALNAGRTLPSEPITVVHRADGSGTSAALTTYLAKHSDRWRDTIGGGISPRFPVGVGAKGNEGVTALVKSTPLSFGYVELVYARQAGLAMAHVPSRAEDDSAYPISVVSYVVIAQESRDRAKAETLAKFLWWAVHDGQAFAPGLDYVALPPPLVARAERELRELRADGRPLLPGGS